MHAKPAKELAQIKGHGLFARVICIVFVGKRDRADSGGCRFHGEDASVADGDAVGVA